MSKTASTTRETSNQKSTPTTTTRESELRQFARLLERFFAGMSI